MAFFPSAPVAGLGRSAPGHPRGRGGAGDGRQRVMKLEVLDALLLEILDARGEAWIGLGVFLEHRIIDLGLVEQMAAQIGLAQHRPGLVVGIGKLGHGDVGGDPAFLHRMTGWGVIAGGGQPQRAARSHVDDRLNRPLAESPFAQHQRAVMILERARDDFRRRSGAGIDQHDQRQSAGKIVGLGVPAFDVRLVAAALRDDLAMLKEGVGDFDRLAEQPAAIGAQVDDIALGLAAQLLLDPRDSRAHVGGGGSAEGVDVEDADAILDLPLHRLLDDDLTGQGQVERVVSTRAEDADDDLAARLAAHLGDGFVERAAIDELAVDMGDEVARLDSRDKKKKKKKKKKS
eukprot:Opistho-1_new@12604